MAGEDAMFDAMDEELGGAEEAVEEESGMDPELAMHAEAAGLDPAQAEAMKMFIERCVALKDGGDYAVEEEPASDEEDFEF